MTISIGTDCLRDIGETEKIKCSEVSKKAIEKRREYQGILERRFARRIIFFGSQAKDTRRRRG